MTVISLQLKVSKTYILGKSTTFHLLLSMHFFFCKLATALSCAAVWPCSADCYLNRTDVKDHSAEAKKKKKKARSPKIFSQKGLKR